MRDWQAIPSYKRPDTLKNKTMKVLKHYGIELEEFIFLQQIQNKKRYMKRIDPKDYHKIIVGVPESKKYEKFYA